MNHTPEQIHAAVEKHGSIRAAAPHLGVDERTVRRHLAKAGGRPLPERAPSAEKPRVKRTADEASFVTPESPDLQLGDLDALMRDRGLDPAEWEVVSATLNEWEGPAGEGEVRTYRQMKVSLKRKPDVAALFPRAAVHVPELVKPARVRKPKDAPQLAIVEFDHQAPYFNPALDAAATAMHADLQPDVQVFGGDLMDFPTISKHPDHPAAMASVNDCIDAGYGILRRRRDAAPHATAHKLKGNHDWRPESELLLRAERMYGIRPARRPGMAEELPALSLRRLLFLDELGVELVEHPLGWQHAEVELVPGTAGLIVRHGWLTGTNTAGKSLAKRGRSMIVGHTHQREHVFHWDPSADLERQAVVAGTMSRVRGEAFDERLRTAAGLKADVDQLFPHFAVCDNWTPGLVTVTTWPSGAFLIEHARWENGALYWRDRAWRA